MSEPAEQSGAEIFESAIQRCPTLNFEIIYSIIGNNNLSHNSKARLLMSYVGANSDFELIKNLSEEILLSKNYIELCKELIFYCRPSSGVVKTISLVASFLSINHPIITKISKGEITVTPVFNGIKENTGILVSGINKLAIDTDSIAILMDDPLNTFSIILSIEEHKSFLKINFENKNFSMSENTFISRPFLIVSNKK